MNWRKWIKDAQIDLGYLQKDFLQVEKIKEENVSQKDIKYLFLREAKTPYGKKLQREMQRVKQRISALYDLSITS